MFVATHMVTTRANSQAFTERLRVEVLKTPGSPAGSSLIFTPSCDAPCRAGGQVAGPLTTGGQFDGAFTFTDATATQHKPKLTITVAPIIPPHVHLDYGTSRTTSVSSPESMS
ncbi:hypothetical protein ABT120_58465 [Nonomuraea angiospora]|uniref:hypothetical protein n=1 Tax=Nonomuraea angiospora TaxID=46172 RepID=UPI00331BFA1F